MLKGADITDYIQSNNATNALLRVNTDEARKEANGLYKQKSVITGNFPERNDSAPSKYIYMSDHLYNPTVYQQQLYE